MENALGEDLPVGTYRTNDKIKNLKLRIKLRKNANACFAEKDSLVFGDPNEIELVNLMKASSVATERVFSWQEKVDKSENADDTVVKSSENGVKKDSISICLFSYTDDNLLSSKWKVKTSSTYPGCGSSPLEERTCNTKPASRPYFPNTDSWQRPLFANVKRIVKEKTGLGTSPLPVGQSMIIMAALFFEDSSTSEEIELCFLHVDDHGTLTVIPDFSSRKSFTFVNSRSETFEYEIENVSSLPKNSAIQREKHLMKKIEMYKRKLKDAVIGTEFLKPDTGTLVLSLNCEIVSAQNFLAADIFVHYLVTVPTDWNTESNLEGVTETCRSKLRNNIRVAQYGYAFSVDLSTEITNYKDEPIKVIFEVTSVDYWGNFRNEGYGFADVTTTPGSQVLEIHTWKIEPLTLRDKLQNYFIGGMPHLDDLSYVINPKETKEAQLSKYGVQTLSSGSISFKTSIIQQRS